MAETDLCSQQYGEWLSEQHEGELIDMWQSFENIVKVLGGQF